MFKSGGIVFPKIKKNSILGNNKILKKKRLKLNENHKGKLIYFGEKGGELNLDLSRMQQLHQKLEMNANMKRYVQLIGEIFYETKIPFLRVNVFREMQGLDPNVLEKVLEVKRNWENNFSTYI